MKTNININNSVKKNYGQFLDINRCLLSLARSMTETKKLNANNKLSHVILFLFAKSCTTFEAIQCLCREAYGTDAVILCRSLFENEVNLKYILLKNKEKRAHLFLNFSLLNWEKYVKNIEWGLLDDEYRKKWESAAKEITGKYQTIKKDYPNKYHWSGKNIRDMARDVGMEKEYNTVYWHQSNIAHPSSVVITEYFTEREENFIYKYGRKAEDIDIPLRQSFVCLFRIISMVNNFFSIGLKKQIGSLKEKFKVMTSWED